MIVSPRRGGEIVREGGIIAYPTETVWGLGGDPFSEEVVSRIYEIKKRPRDKGFILLVSDIKMIAEIVESVTPEEKALMEKFWPGPLTIIFPVKDRYRDKLGSTVGLRISPHPVVTEIIEASGIPIVSTSANLSGREPVSSMDNAIELFEGEVDAVVEGECWGQKPSTIVDLRGRKLLRAGAIPEEELRPFLDW